MSLILDALKKLEQEKEARGERSVLVLGQVPWESVEPRRRRRWPALVGGALLVGAASLAAWALLGTRAPRSEPQPPAPADLSAAAPAGNPAAVAVRPAEPTPPAAELAQATAPPASAPLPAPPARASASAQPPQTPAPNQPSRPARTAAAPPDTSPSDLAPRAAAAAGAPGTRPSEPSGPEPLQLHAISDQDGVPVALINERVVREGDVFGDVKVLRIGSTEVEIEVRGRRRVLRF